MDRLPEIRWNVATRPHRAGARLLNDAIIPERIVGIQPRSFGLVDKRNVFGAGYAQIHSIRDHVWYRRCDGVPQERHKISVRHLVNDQGDLAGLIAPVEKISDFFRKHVTLNFNRGGRALVAGRIVLHAGRCRLQIGQYLHPIIANLRKRFAAFGIGFALVENGWRVMFMRTSDLVQRLQIARRELALESALAKLDKYHLLILDDIVYVSKDQAETSVLFELIGSRYERRSMLITANQPFGEWGKVFPDQAMTLAAIDRLVHHATIFEMNVESYRRRAALDRKRGGPGRPPTRATIKENAN